MAERRKKLEITIINAQKQYCVDSAVYRRFIAAVIAECGMEADQVSVLFTDDEEMKRLNRIFRHRNRTTDVISFEAGERNIEGLINIGDIVISVPKAFRQARAARWTMEKEIKKLLVHALLHLTGYDHEKDSGAMNTMEDAICRKLGADG